MRRRRFGLAGLLVALLAIVLLVREGSHSSVAPPSARPGSYEVTRIVDGDTLHVNIPSSPTPDEKVRVLRINTPERGAPGYERATACMLSLVQGKRVELEWERPGTPERDEYGRLLAYVWVGDPAGTEPRLLVNVEVVRQGYSRFFTKYGEGRYAERFRAAEDDARTAQRGLWNADGFNKTGRR